MGVAAAVATVVADVALNTTEIDLVQTQPPDGYQNDGYRNFNQRNEYQDN